MKLRNFLKLMAMALMVPMAFTACENEEPQVPVVKESVVLDTDDVDLLVGESKQINAIAVVDPAATSKVINWTSSDSSVATVDANGKVTAVAPGKAIITASLGDGRPSATCEIEVDVEDALLVFNGGNMYSSIDGSLSQIRFEKSQTVTYDVFADANGRSLGATVQDGIIFGENLYIAVDGSNTIEVVNKNTFKSVTTILPDETAYEPRDIVADDNYVYVSMYTGHVSRIDPKTNKIDKTVAVGPNPEEMVIEDGYLYVVNSDGLNYGANYENGKTVSKINLKSFTEEKKIDVGLNPTAIQESDGKIFVLCMGNYYDIPSTIYTIDKNDNAVDTGVEATFFAENDGVLYVVYYPYYQEGTTCVSYKASDMSVISSSFIDISDISAAAGIAVDEDRIFVSSYNIVNGKTSYETDGYVNEYKLDGTLVKKYDVGVGPVHMLVVD